MKRFGYFEQLSLAARWLLPHEEAKDMIEDYKDILFDLRGPEEAYQHFGPPWKPVVETIEPVKVRRWHVAFLYMMFCTLFPLLYRFSSGGIYDPELCFNLLVTGFVLWLGWEVLLAGKYSKLMFWLLGIGGSALVIICGMVMPAYLAAFWRNGSPIPINEPETFCLGAVISLIYFGFGKMRGMGNRKFSKPLLASILIVFLAVAAVYWFTYYSLYVNVYPIAYHESFFNVVFTLLLILFTLSAVASIFLSKLYDRRWRAVFILSLVGIAFCMDLAYITSEHFFKFDSTTPNFFSVFFDRANPRYLFEHRLWGTVNVLDEVFYYYSLYGGVGAALAVAGLF